MALRDQPYFPLYVQDFLTDEKLNNCSASSQGVYIKIMCVLHKQENYGKFLFKQKHKQKSSMTENFALMFARQLSFDYETILNALTELVDEGVLKIEGEILSQKRMVKDFEISQLRSEAAKKGGGNPNLFKQKPKQPFKQNSKQNPEYEIEYENESKVDIKDVKKRAEKRNLNFGTLQDSFIEKWDVWIKFKKSQFKQTYKTIESEQVAVNLLIKISGGDCVVAEQIIQRSIGQLWKGLFELNNENQKNGESTTKLSGKKFGRIPEETMREFINRGPIPKFSGEGYD